jgi:hypothetical protein
MAKQIVLGEESQQANLRSAVRDYGFVVMYRRCRTVGVPRT